MVKWTKKCSGFLKPSFFGQTPKSGSEVLFELGIFCDNLYCCVKNLNVKNKIEIFKTYH